MNFLGIYWFLMVESELKRLFYSLFNLLRGYKTPAKTNKKYFMLTTNLLGRFGVRDGTARENISQPSDRLVGWWQERKRFAHLTFTSY